MARGLLITFEGPEGSGKTTQMGLAASFLQRQGYKVLVTRQPGGTAWGVALRRALLQTRHTVSPMAELFLYEADRAQHVTEIIQPALKKGLVILCDRFIDSTVAYQGFGRGLDRPLIEEMNAAALQGVRVDGTILLDVAVERGLRRAAKRQKGADRIERAGTAFHQRVRKGFLQLAARDKKRFHVIAPTDSIEQTQRAVTQALTTILQKAKKLR